jgi:hypothetical protein
MDAKHDTLLLPLKLLLLASPEVLLGHYVALQSVQTCYGFRSSAHCDFYLNRFCIVIFGYFSLKTK